MPTTRGASRDRASKGVTEECGGVVIVHVRGGVTCSEPGCEPRGAGLFGGHTMFFACDSALGSGCVACSSDVADARA